MFGMLLAAALVVAGADGLSAQQGGSMRADSTTHHVRHHTRTHKHMTRKATTHHARRHAVKHTRTRTTTMRTRETTRPVVTYTRPNVIGREIGPSGISSTGRLQRLANGLITPDAARTIALQHVPAGTTVSKIELQSEDGRQVYDVKVMTPNQRGNEKVRVDAHTGQVVEIKNVDNPIGTVTNTVKSGVDKVTGHH